MKDAGLDLGPTAGGAPLRLPSAVMLRHAMALGSSGSGKTVLCKVIVEEMLARGVPVIAIDPQGDLCSLAAPIDEQALRERGLDPEAARAFRERIDPVIFTPGSTRGVPLCADPIDPGLGELAPGERPGALARPAAIVVSLLGFALETDDGAGLCAVIDSALAAVIERGERPSLTSLGAELERPEREPTYARLLEAKKLKIARQRIARLDVGARRALFHGGVPIDVGVLLGRDPRALAAEGKTRLAIVYLNTLHQQEDTDFFVAARADRLYAWMLAHPKSDPQLLFYIDEVAPFIPPVRKPACKDGLALLFKQARKYGVSCLMATQNPGDVDYRAMAQFGTWALGRLTTRQDLKKIEPTLRSLAPVQGDALSARLPALTPGRFVVLSPDALEAPAELITRWLHTPHQTWDEARVARFSDGVRERFAALLEPEEPASEPKTARKPEAEPEPEADPAPARVEPCKRSTKSSSARSPARAAPARSEDRSQAVLQALGARSSSTVRELAALIGVGEAVVRRALERLAEGGDARSFRQGRTQQWWSPKSGARPDLGLPPKVHAIVAQITREDAERFGRDNARTRTLGLIGEDESLAGVEPLWRALYKLDFEEKRERPLMGRLFGAAHDEHLGSVYVHPENFGVVFFTREDGLKFVDLPEAPASTIRDFDGVVQVTEVAPVHLAIDESDWRKRRGEDEALASFRRRFKAAPRAITPIFVPLWQVCWRGETAGLRRVLVDGIAGKPVRWL